MKRARRHASRAGSVQYKVVEVATVDEVSLERALNEWVRQGWALDGVQFAMRESSRRPAMAFLFFTRRGQATAGALARAPQTNHGVAPADARVDEAWARLRRLAGEGGEP